MMFENNYPEEEEAIQIPESTRVALNKSMAQAKVDLEERLKKTWDEVTKVTDRKKRGGGRNRNTVEAPSATLKHLLGKIK